MEQGGVERRRGRRVPMQASIIVRRTDNEPSRPVEEHPLQNISLAGAYFETTKPDHFSLNEQVLASISVPEDERRTFPFARLAGRSRVVRIEELPPAPEEPGKRFGVALEFGKDVTALTAIPPRG